MLTGQKLQVFNGECGAESGFVPVSAAAPAMLFSEIEVQKTMQGRDRHRFFRHPGSSRCRRRQSPNRRITDAPTPHFSFHYCLSVLLFNTAAQTVVTVAPRAIVADDHGDPVLRAMLTELTRSQQKLQLGEFQRPYYIDYQLLEVQDYLADAKLGALNRDQSNRSRFVTVSVRIGDYKHRQLFS